MTYGHVLTTLYDSGEDSRGELDGSEKRWLGVRLPLAISCSGSRVPRSRFRIPRLGSRRREDGRRDRLEDGER